MTGFLLALGNLGAIVATTPLAWAPGCGVDGVYSASSYQDAFLLCFLAVAICLGLALFLQKRPTGKMNAP